jgi:hypothetical protein
MKKITNREEANQYYSQVNELVDDYIKKWKVKPTEIYSYFKRNMRVFLEKSGLSEIDGITRVINDVLEHRRGMQLDGIIKFENFNYITESVININKSTVEHEKVLSDFYKTSIGHVEVIDAEVHLFKINDFGKKVISIIFSDSELDEIKNNIVDSIVEDSKNKALSISEIDGVDIGISIRFWLSDIIDQEKYKEVCKNKITNENLLLIIKKTIQKRQDFPTNFSNDRLSYKDDFKGYHIWEVR